MSSNVDLAEYIVGVAPEPQPMRELRHANEVRVAAADLRREIAAGVLDLADGLEDDRSGCLRLVDLLRARRGWERPKARAFIRGTVPIHFADTRCRDLPPRIRATLVRELRRYEETR